MHYMPPKISSHETGQEWLNRMVKSKNPTFARTPIHEYFPKKWGLIHMAPYDQPYGKYVGFLPSVYQYPCLMQDAEKLLLLIEENNPAPESHEASIKAVKNDIALIAFDLTQPLDTQIKRGISLLKLHYKEMQKYKKINRTGTPKLLTNHLVRHLRVLDARRAFPDITAADIARKLGYKEFIDSEKTAAQQGARWLKQAEKARDNYLNFLITGKSTTKNT